MIYRHPVHRNTSVMCYKCNKLLGDAFFSDLMTHLKTDSHKDCDVVWYQTLCKLPEKVSFPKIGLAKAKIDEIKKDRFHLLEDIKRGIVRFCFVTKRTRKKALNMDDIRDQFIEDYMHDSKYARRGWHNLSSKTLARITEAFRVTRQEAAKYDRAYSVKSKQSTKLSTARVSDTISVTESMKKETEEEKEARKLYTTILKFDPLTDMERALKQAGSPGTKNYLKLFTNFYRTCKSKKENMPLTYADAFKRFLVKKRSEKNAITNDALNNYINAINFFISQVLKNEEPKLPLLKVPSRKEQDILETTQLVPEVLARMRDEKKGTKELFAWELALFTGLRIHELAKLKLSDMSIRTINGEKWLVVSVLGKGNKQASVHLKDPRAFELYNEINESQDTDDYIFLDDALVKNLPLNKLKEVATKKGDLLSKQIKTLNKRYFGKSASAHDMRRTFASYLTEQGVDIKTISQQLRHSNISTTERYINAQSRQRATLKDMTKVAPIFASVSKQQEESKEQFESDDMEVDAKSLTAEKLTPKKKKKRSQKLEKKLRSRSRR